MNQPLLDRIHELEKQLGLAQAEAAEGRLTIVEWNLTHQLASTSADAASQVMRHDLMAIVTRHVQQRRRDKLPVGVGADQRLQAARLDLEDLAVSFTALVERLEGYADSKDVDRCISIIHSLIERARQ